MVVYFSATGNTRYVASELARLLDDEAIDLCPRIRANDFSDIACAGTLVVCSPVHVSGLPKFLADYLRRTSFPGASVGYGVVTDAGYSGIAGYELQQIFEAKGLEYRGLAEFVLPGTHITSVTSQSIEVEEICRRIRQTASRLPVVARRIRQGRALEGRKVHLAEVALTVPLMPLLRHVGFGTRRFCVTDACVSCGLCERVCPVVAITMREGRPYWNTSHCAHCMACIHNCPTEAIEYGDVTPDKRRYTFSRYRYAAEDVGPGAG